MSMNTLEQSILEGLEKQFATEDDGGHVATTCEPCLDASPDPTWRGYTDCGLWDDNGLWYPADATCQACIDAPLRVYCARCGQKIDWDNE